MYSAPQLSAPIAPPTFEPISCLVAEEQLAHRYQDAINAYPTVRAQVGLRRLRAQQLAHHQLDQDRFYQFKMWLQSAEGQNYLRWENEACAVLEIIEPINAAWMLMWLELELGVLGPIVDWLAIFDAYTAQLLTYADLNPAARLSISHRSLDPLNPIPYEVLKQRLPERDQVAGYLNHYGQIWLERLGIPLGTGWRTSWGSASADPVQLATWLRGFIEQVAFRLWSPSELPQIPALPSVALSGALIALPQQFADHIGSIEEQVGGKSQGFVSIPEPPVLSAQPPSIAPMDTRWLRGSIVVGRAVCFSRGRPAWAEGVALQESISFRESGLGDGVAAIRVQRSDGAVAWFDRSSLKGLR